jgi:hypothetical protein
VWAISWRTNLQAASQGPTQGLSGGRFAEGLSQGLLFWLEGCLLLPNLENIIRLGALDNRAVRILDFGCGTSHLGQLLAGKVIGYDIIPELGEISDWRMAQFDVVVANEVFYSFDARQLTHFLRELRMVNPHVELLVGISRQGLFKNV